MTKTQRTAAEELVRLRVDGTRTFVEIRGTGQHQHSATCPEGSGAALYQGSDILRWIGSACPSCRWEHQNLLVEDGKDGFTAVGTLARWAELVEDGGTLDQLEEFWSLRTDAKRTFSDLDPNEDRDALRECLAGARSREVRAWLAARSARARFGAALDALTEGPARATVLRAQAAFEEELTADARWAAVTLPWRHEVKGMLGVLLEAYQVEGYSAHVVVPVQVLRALEELWAQAKEPEALAVALLPEVPPADVLEAVAVLLKDDVEMTLAAALSVAVAF